MRRSPRRHRDLGEDPAHSESGQDRPAGSESELDAERDRLTERFALMQSELGGLFYEMAIRDHVNMELLIERAAALQRVEADLVQVCLLYTSPSPRDS